MFFLGFGEVTNSPTFILSYNMVQALWIYTHPEADRVDGIFDGIFQDIPIISQDPVKNLYIHLYPG